MSVKAMTWAFEQAIPPTLKVVLLALADHADENNVCWPSIARLAVKSSMSERTVQRNIQDLEFQGYIEKKSTFSDVGRQMSNHYVLLLGEGVRLSPRGDTEGGEGDTIVRGRVTPVSPPRVSTVSPLMNPHIEPSLEPRESALSKCERILRDEDFKLSTWEDGFLSNLLSRKNWTKDQTEAFEAIASRYDRKALEEPKPLFGGPRPTTSNGKVYVKSGTPAWDAWGDWYRKNRKVSPPTDQTGGWWFETEYPTEVKVS
jgi:hypothetical protein